MFIKQFNWFNKNSGKKLSKREIFFLDIIEGVDYYILFPIAIFLAILWRNKVFVLGCVILYLFLKHFSPDFV